MSRPAIKILVDRSGSMASVTDASKAIQGFIDERRTQNDNPWISLSEFDDVYNVVYYFQSITNTPEYVLKPRGSTALNDSIAQAVKELDEFRPGKPRDKYLVIMTDGYENASREHTKESVKKLLEDRQAKGLKVVYLGANQDAVSVAQSYAIPTHAAMTWRGGHGAKMSMTRAAGMSVSSLSYAQGFTEADRSAAVEE